MRDENGNSIEEMMNAYGQVSYADKTGEWTVTVSDETGTELKTFTVQGKTQQEPSEPNEPTQPDKPTQPQEPDAPDKPSEPDEPNTPNEPQEPDMGDTSENKNDKGNGAAVALFAILLVLLAGGAVAFALVRKFRNKKNNNKQ